MTKLLVLADALSPEGVAILEDSAGLNVADLSAQPREALKDRLGTAAGLIVRSSTQADADLLASAAELEVIGRAGVGLDNIDVEEATRRGIAVLNAPAGNTVSTAELAFALLLSAARKIVAADRSLRSGEWDRKRFRGPQLSGKTLGVIGAGRIGTEVVRRGRAFGMKVLIFDPFLPAGRAADLDSVSVPLERLLRESDFITLHSPLTEENQGLIGTEAIKLMKPEAILVNAARGGLVDEEALAEALHEGRLGGAALDVYETEPLPADHPLRDAPGLVLTPHLGSATPEAQREVAIEIATAVRDALLDGDLRSAVNMPAVAEPARYDPIEDMARRLGLVLSELTGGRARRVDIRLSAPFEHSLRLVAAAVMEGYLSPVLARPLNLVNSLLIAADRGIEVRRSRSPSVAGYSIFLELSAECGEDCEDCVIGGTLLGAKRSRLVRVGSYHIGAAPAGNLLFVRNRDVPGVIGEIGTHLGAAGLNIAGFHQARDSARGDALAVIRVDEAIPDALLKALREHEAITDVRQVSFGD
ncbi:MAG: phosphoglycerate dehydrogenase [Gemmatimonadota bacterium]